MEKEKKIDIILAWVWVVAALVTVFWNCLFGVATQERWLPPHFNASTKQIHHNRISGH